MLINDDIFRKYRVQRWCSSSFSKDFKHEDKRDDEDKFWFYFWVKTMSNQWFSFSTKMCNIYNNFWIRNYFIAERLKAHPHQLRLRQLVVVVSRIANKASFIFSVMICTFLLYSENPVEMLRYLKTIEWRKVLYCCFCYFAWIKVNRGNG